MKKYKIIYADPPWFYNDRRKNGTRFGGGGNLPLQGYALARD